MRAPAGVAFALAVVDSRERGCSATGPSGGDGWSDRRSRPPNRRARLSSFSGRESKLGSLPRDILVLSGLPHLGCHHRWGFVAQGFLTPSVLPSSRHIITTNTNL